MDSSLQDVATVKEVASFLKVSERTIMRIIKKKAIRCTKIGGQWRFSKDWVLDYLNKKNDK